jgi:hypothetical protein
MVKAMTVQTQLEPTIHDGAGVQAPARFCADPEMRVQPVLSVEMPAGSPWPAIRKTLRLVAMIIGGLFALILLSFMVETR